MLKNNHEIVMDNSKTSNNTNKSALSYEEACEEVDSNKELAKDEHIACANDTNSAE